MQSRRERHQEDLFVTGPLRDLVPADHILRRLDAVLDLGWLHAELRDCYCPDNGRPSIDPECALRFMLAGFLEGIVHDRTLMRRAQTDLAFRWFAGYRLDEVLPDHSSLTRIRQRWGTARFKKIFERTVSDCVKAGLVRGDTVHVDATLIRADVSWGSLTREHVEQVLESNAEEDGNDESPPAPKRGRRRTKPVLAKKKSTTDPEASMATSRRDFHLEPTFKQHTAVDDQVGVIVDVAVQTGEANEGRQLLEQLGRIEANTGRTVSTLTADKGYAHAANYAGLEQRSIAPIIPPQAIAVRKPGEQKIPVCRFKYDERKDRITCPAGKWMTAKTRTTKGNGYIYRARQADCQNCPMRERCISSSARARSVLIMDGHCALLRARRQRARGWKEEVKTIYRRHCWLVEGAHGRAKAHHGLRRAARRGLDNVAIQSYLTAAVMNLKKMAQHKLAGGLNSTLGTLYKRLWTLTTPQIRLCAA